MYIKIMMHEHNSFRKYFVISLKTFNFAANKNKKVSNESFTQQGNFRSAKEFLFCLFFYAFLFGQSK